SKFERALTQAPLKDCPHRAILNEVRRQLWRGLAAPNRSVARARRSESGWPGTGGRLAHAIQQIFEHGCVVVGFVLRRKQKREALSFVGQAIKRQQIFFGFRTRQLFQVTLAKKLPVVGLGVEPFAEFVGGSEISQPLDGGDVGFAQAARPQPVYQDAGAVRRRYCFVNSLHGDWHGYALSL